jgi:hypothetical protein
MTRDVMHLFDLQIKLQLGYRHMGKASILVLRST